MNAIDEVLSILADSKTVLELPTATSPIAADWAIIWNTASGRLEKVPYSLISGASNWVWIDGSQVEKGIGNNDLTILEIGDEIYFKKITNAGDPLTLVGQTYDGGDKQLEASYTQNQAITT